MKSARSAPPAPVAGTNAYRAAIRRLRPAMVAVGLFSAVISILMLTGSVYMLQVYDRVLSSGSVPTLMALFTIVVILYAFLGFYDFLRARLLSRAALKLDLMAGTDAFRTWVRSGIPGGTDAATVAARRDPGLAREAAEAQPLRDLDTMRGFLSGPAIVALFDVPFVPLYLGVLFLIHPWLGWLTVAGSAVVALVAFANRAVTKAAIRDAMSADGTEREFADKSRRNAEAIVAMGMEQAVTARWRGLHDTSLVGGQRGSDPSEMLAAFSRAFKMLLQSAILSLGAFLVLRGEITAGMIIASTILSGRALTPVDQVIGMWRTIGKASEAHRRLDVFFEGRAEARPRIELPDPQGRIVVSRLTKLAPGRPGTERARILNQVSFALEPGDGLGVIGNSASGKSTLARLLVGAWTPDGGEIRLDGATPDQWDPTQLGRHVGYLPQTLEMLPGSIRDNIARFDPQASDTGVIEAATLAGVHEMILRLPDGYATQLGAGGGDLPLSGGQIQRLGLARAIYGMPRIVVLDEPNSNLDVAGDDALTGAIAALRAAGSTVIVMAHRPSAIAAVNKVLILHGGMVAQFGPKDEVLAAAVRPALPGTEAPAPKAPSDMPPKVAARIRAVTAETDEAPAERPLRPRPSIFRPSPAALDRRSRP